MVSKKLKERVLQDIKRSFVATPSTFLMASLLSFLVLPHNIAAAEEITSEEVDAEQLILPEREENESSLDYLVLTDEFVTAERIPSERLNTPANVIVITAAQIEANHYKSIQEAISHINGAYFSQAEWNLNGSTRLAVLVDGHRTDYTPPMQTIERIEILKGGASALYGSEAVGGVINVITKNGTADQTTLDFSTGSWHTHMYELMNQGTSEKFNWLIYGGLSQARAFDFDGNKNTAFDLNKISDSDKKDAFLKMNYQINDRNSLSVSYQHLGDRHNKYGALNAGDPYPYYYDKANDFSLTYNFKEGTSTPGFLRYIDNAKVERTLNTINDYHTHMQGIDYQNGWEFDNHKFIAGLEYHRTKDFGYLLNYDHRKVNNTAYYLQDTITMDDKWTVIPGVRLDHNSAFGNQWSPKLAANYRADDNTKIFASWGKTYRAPTINELYGEYHDYYNFYGNSNLHAEKGHAANIGFEHSFDDRSVVRLNLFQNKINGIIYPTTLIPDVSEQYTNNYSDKNRGIDLSWAQKMDDNWSYDVGYVYTHSSGGIYHDPEWMSLMSPRHSYHIDLHYDNGPLKANLFGIMVSGFPNSSKLSSTNYTRLDLNVSYDVTDWATIYFKGLNLTDQDYSYHHRILHSPGRFFMAGAQFKF